MFPLLFGLFSNKIASFGGTGPEPPNQTRREGVGWVARGCLVEKIYIENIDCRGRTTRGTKMASVHLPIRPPPPRQPKQRAAKKMGKWGSTHNTAKSLFTFKITKSLTMQTHRPNRKYLVISQIRIKQVLIQIDRSHTIVAISKWSHRLLLDKGKSQICNNSWELV